MTIHGYDDKRMVTIQVLMLLYFLTFIRPKAHGSEIIHGKMVPDGMMPYMASVQKNRNHVCGGFLISEDFVLTAAHCDKSEPTSVVLGTRSVKKVDETTMRYNVTRCNHPNYRNVTSGNDIMLLKLSKKVKLNKKVQLIPIPKGERKLKNKAKCRVAGWGFTKAGGKVSNVLKVAEVYLTNPKECKSKWKYLRTTLPDNVICTGGHKEKEGFCKGDSGGPLVCGRIATGIVSFNHKCDPDVPNIYTDVSKYLTWIKKIVKHKHC